MDTSNTSSNNCNDAWNSGGLVKRSNSSQCNNSNNTSNESFSTTIGSDPSSFSVPTGNVKYIIMTVQVVLVLIIFSGNSLILLAIRKGKLMVRVTYLFIGNLAVADMLFGLALALRIIFMVTETLNTGTCVLILSMAAITALSSFTGILLLSLESYLQVRRGIVFKTGLTPKLARGLILGSWFAWGLFCCLLLYHPDADIIPASQCHFAHPYFNRIFVTGQWVLFASLFTGILVLQTLAIYHIKQHARSFLNNDAAQDPQPPINESGQLKQILGRIVAMSQLTVTIFVCFVVTWGPITLAFVLIKLCPGCGVTGQHLVYLTLLTSINSATNVVILAIKSKEFKKTFRSMLLCQGNAVGDGSHL